MLARFLEPELRLALFGHVAGDLGKANDLPVVAADGVDHHHGPEARAVLAHAPAFGFIAPGVAGGLQGPVGDTGLPVLGRIEAAEMLADDFLGLVSLDALGAGIPVRHMTFGIEHEDRVIDD